MQKKEIPITQRGDLTQETHISYFLFRFLQRYLFLLFLIALPIFHSFHNLWE